MHDKQFLEWLRDRLHYKHKENLSVDFMLKLQAIINNTDPQKLTPSTTNGDYFNLEDRQP